MGECTAMTFTILTTEQRTDAWRQARLGRLTASRACDMLAATKTGGEAAARRDLRLELVVERLTGRALEDGYVSKDMQRGIDKEADAVAAYEAATGELVHPVGFLAHPTLMAGASPDGEIGGYTGLLEVKCPKAATHLATLRSRQVPKDYLAQIQHAIWITGAQWCDFVSFDDRFPPALQLFVIRIKQTDVDLKAYELLARLFLAEVDRDYDAVAHLADLAVA
jgi:predicted phage-related endonuclease